MLSNSLCRLAAAKAVTSPLHRAVSAGVVGRSAGRFSCVRRSPALPKSSGAASALVLPRRGYSDKILVGAVASTLTSTTVLALFHLIVTPLTALVAVSTVVTAAVSGSLTVLEGGDNTTSLGAIFGIVIGAMGGFYGKSQMEPWRK